MGNDLTVGGRLKDGTFRFQLFPEELAIDKITVMGNG
jgi:hypothetical protein